MSSSLLNPYFVYFFTFNIMIFLVIQSHFIEIIRFSG